MRLHRFYIPEALSGQRLATGEIVSIKSHDLVNQIRRVFRLKNGDKVMFFDGSGFDFECEIMSGSKDSHADKDSVAFCVLACERSRYMPTKEIYLCAAITKKDTFEWIVEKATELGVTHIVPVLAERSEKKALNMERLNKIALEASEQSGRGNVPTIAPIGGLGEVIEKIEVARTIFGQNDGLKSSIKNPCDLNLLAMHTEGNLLSQSDISRGNMAIFIGPEGGWSPDEIDVFHKYKIPVLCLGNQVLRAETAVVVALSKVVFPN